MEITRLLEATRRAIGGDAWDGIRAIYLKSTLLQGGLDCVLEQWQDVITGRYAQRFRLGITSGGEGFDGGIPWSVDAAGYSRREDNGDAREAAANNAYRTCMAWCYADRWKAQPEYVGLIKDDCGPCHVLRVTPNGGRPFDLWIDATTFLITQTVEQSAFETITRSFSDYRIVDDVRLPFRIRISNGHSMYDQEYEVQRVELNPEGMKERLRVPQSPAPDFQIAGEHECAAIPFRLIENLVVVDVSVDGRRPLPFIVDTGGVNLVTPEAAQKLGLNPQGAFWGFGGGEDSVEMRVAAVASMEFGGVLLSDQVVWVYPLNSLKDVLGLAEFGGLLGYEIFRRFVVKVNYQREMLTLTRPECFSYADHGTVIPFTFFGNLPEVQGDLDGIAGKFGLDTGNTGTLILNAPFVERHGLIENYGATETQVGDGAGGGSMTFLAARAERLRMGGVEIPNLAIALSCSKTGALSNSYSAGLVGAEIFKRFTIIFDHSRQQVIFEENGH